MAAHDACTPVVDVTGPKAYVANGNICVWNGDCKRVADP
jgi:hypothetical protein